MKIRQYLLAAILLLVFMGAYIYFDGANEPVTKSIFGYEFTFISAVWAMVPAIILLVASVAHMVFYSTVNFFRKQALEKDQKSLKKLIIHSLFGEGSNLSLKHPQLTALGRLLAGSQLLLKNGEIESGDIELDAVINQIRSVKNGEYVTFTGAFKPTKNSPIWIENQLNRVRKDPKASEELLKECKENTPYCEELLEHYSHFGDKKRILKTPLTITPKVALNILSRHKNGTNPIDFTIDEIVQIAKRANFKEQHYITLAKALKNAINPDELMEIFYQFHSDPDIDEAQTAWIYINLELERIDTAREILDSSKESECLPFKYYLALKDAGMMPKLDEIIR